MKWFNRWFNKKVAQALANDRQDSNKESAYYVSPPQISKGTLVGSLKGSDFDSSNSIRLNVSKARGGVVVETSFYDQQRDRSQQGLYIITDNQDVGKELNKIITMEALKR